MIITVDFEVVYLLCDTEVFPCCVDFRAIKRNNKPLNNENI